MKKKFLILVIVLIILIVILIIMGIFSFLKTPKIIETKTFSEISGFSFEYPVFKGLEVKNIEMIDKNTYSIFLNEPVINDDKISSSKIIIPPISAPRFQVAKKVIDNLPTADMKNAQGIFYKLVQPSEDSAYEYILFLGKDFVVEIDLFGIGKSFDFSKGVFWNKIVETFKFTCSPEEIGAVKLSELTSTGTEAVIERLKQDKENPDDFYANIKQEGQNLIFELSHKDDFKPENCPKDGNPSGKSRNIYYNLELKKVTKSLFWQ